MASRKAAGFTRAAVTALRRLFAPLAGSGRGLLGITMLGILMVAGGYLGWAKWGALIKQRPQYVLTAESFEITPQPAWIQTDVRAEVMRDASLAQLSVLHPDLTKRVVQAFELNTWVAEVLSAGKSPGRNGPRVIVQLRYREPVIMVRTRDARWKGDCFWPVDTEGVFLPPDEFSASQTRNYLRVEAGNSPPVGAVGTTYGDPAVAGAAGVATVIGEAWKSMGLQWIMVHREPAAEIGQPADSTYVLLTTGANPQAMLSHRTLHMANAPNPDDTSVEIRWGHAPGRESVGEATAAQKIVRLRQFVSQHGRLDHLPPTTTIDLRPGPAMSVMDQDVTFKPASLP